MGSTAQTRSGPLTLDGNLSLYDTYGGGNTLTVNENGISVDKSPLILNSTTGQSVGIGTNNPATKSLTIGGADGGYQICLNGTGPDDCTNTSPSKWGGYWSLASNGKDISNSNSGKVTVSSEIDTPTLNASTGVNTGTLEADSNIDTPTIWMNDADPNTDSSQQYYLQNWQGTFYVAAGKNYTQSGHVLASFSRTDDSDQSTGILNVTGAVQAPTLEARTMWLSDADPNTASSQQYYLQDWQGNFYINPGKSYSQTGSGISIDPSGNLTAQHEVKTPTLCLGSDCRSSWPSTTSVNPQTSYYTFTQQGGDVYYNVPGTHAFCALAETGDYDQRCFSKVYRTSGSAPNYGWSISNACANQPGHTEIAAVCLDF